MRARHAEGWRGALDQIGHDAGRGTAADAAGERNMNMIRRFGFGVLAYLAPTFVLGFVWHLILFPRYYEALAIYRKDVIIPFGSSRCRSRRFSSPGFTKGYFRGGAALCVARSRLCRVRRCS